MQRFCVVLVMLVFFGSLLFAGGAQEEIEIDPEDVDLPEQFMWPEDELGSLPTFPEYQGETIELTIETFSGGQAPYLEFFGENFNALFPHFEVEFEVQIVPFGEMHDGLGASLIAGTGAPDIITPHIGAGAARFFQQPYADEFLEIELPDGLQGQIARTSEYSDEQGRLLGVENAGAHPGFLYYRADLFEEAGVEMPIETWDEYVEAGEKLRENGHYLTSFGFQGPSEVSELFSLAIVQGNTLWDGDEFILNDDRTLEGLEAMVELINSGLALDAGFDEEDTIRRKVGAVEEGQIASFIGADWVFNTRLMDHIEEPNWRIQGVPRLPGAVADYFTWGGTGLSVVESQTDYPELAEAFLLYTLASGNQLYKFEEYLHLPVNQIALNDPVIAEYTAPEYFGDQVIGEVFVDGVQNMAGFELGNGYSAVDDQLEATLNEALDDPEGWLQDLEDYWRAAIN